MEKLINQYIRIVKKSMKDIALLGVRAILVFTFIGPAIMKVTHIKATASWFDQLGIPFPTFSTYLVFTVEGLGVALLAIGLATEFIALPLVVVMLVAIFTVHISNGWNAIAPSENPEIAERLSAAKDLLSIHGNYERLTEKGSFVILNNGIEFPAIYLVLLFVILAFGSGKLSIDYLLYKKRS